MGSFNGHILPGAFLFLFGAWWAFSAWRLYILSRLGRRDYLSTASFAVPKLSNRLCIEGLVKIVFASLGAVAEIATAYEDGKFTRMGNAQHTSMYIFYGLSGLADLLTFHEAPVPHGTDYSLLLFAVCAEAFLFHFHLHGRSHLDVLVHTLLIYTIVAKAACIAVEMIRRRSALATLGRAFFQVVQGTWFFQVAFILYNPLPSAKPWGDGHQDLMLATAVYTWHMIGALACVTLMGVVSWVWCSRYEGVDKNGEVRYSLLSDRPITMRSGADRKSAQCTESDFFPS